MNSFDEIYILDLHGNSLKKEKAPDGSKDENVFDIQQGVAIALFVKGKQSIPSKILMHSGIWGAREQKYEWLTKHELKKNVSREVWEYHIGGYQVSEKWLKDRKGKELSSEEVAHYARVVTAIAETIGIQRFLDDLFAEVETSLLEVSL